MSVKKIKRKVTHPKESLAEAIDVLQKHGNTISEFLFGTPTTEVLKKGIEALFPSNDLREKTRLNPRDVRACLFLKLAGKWRAKPFGDVADEFMELQISRDGLGRQEMTEILALTNLIERLPKELASKLTVGNKEGSGNEKKQNAD